MGAENLPYRETKLKRIYFRRSHARLRSPQLTMIGMNGVNMKHHTNTRSHEAYALLLTEKESWLALALLSGYIVTVKASPMRSDTLPSFSHIAETVWAHFQHINPQSEDSEDSEEHRTFCVVHRNQNNVENFQICSCQCFRALSRLKLKKKKNNKYSHRSGRQRAQLKRRTWR